MMDDAELLRRYAEARDEGAFRALVDRHIQFVYSTAQRRLNDDRQAAEDVAQLVFTAAAKQARVLGRGVVFPAWLHRTTRNISIDLVRAQAQRRRREQEAIAMHETSPATPEKLRPLLDAAIDELGEKDRTAIVLRFFSQLPLAQVGATLRVSEDAARMRIERALGRLQATLARRGITSTAAALAGALADEALAATAPEGIAARVCGSALSAAKAGGSGAMATIGIMGTMKTLVTAAVLLGALGLASFEVGRWRTAWAEHAEADRAVAAATVAAKAAKSKADDAEQALASVRQRVAALHATKSKTAPAAGAAPAATSGSAADPWDDWAQGTEFMKRHPEVRAALRDYVHARARFDFGPFLDSLQLSPEARERLEEFMMLGTGMGAQVPGDTSGRHQITLSMGGTPAERQDKMEKEQAWLTETVGPDALERIDTYRKEAYLRDDVARIAGTLWDTDSPLTPAQASQLQTALSNHQTVVKRRATYDWDGVVAAAQSFLTPTQISAIEGLRAQAQFNSILLRPAGTAPTSASPPPSP